MRTENCARQKAGVSAVKKKSLVSKIVIKRTFQQKRQHEGGTKKRRVQTGGGEGNGMFYLGRNL